MLTARVKQPLAASTVAYQNGLSTSTGLQGEARQESYLGRPVKHEPSVAISRVRPGVAGDGARLQQSKTRSRPLYTAPKTAAEDFTERISGAGRTSLEASAHGTIGERWGGSHPLSADQHNLQKVLSATAMSKQGSMMIGSGHGTLASGVFQEKQHHYQPLRGLSLRTVEELNALLQFFRKNPKPSVSISE